MRPNYSGNKKRKEEAHRKKQEEKRNRRLNKSKDRQTQPLEASVMEEPQVPPQVV